MTRHIHIEMIGGLAGDMFIAAALDTGLIEPAWLERHLSAAGLGPVQLISKRVLRHGISATHISFAGPAIDQPQPERQWADIDATLATSQLDAPIRERARALLRALAEVEARVHGIPIERVHFHEIGAADSILDFVGAAAIIHQLNARWSCSPAPQGQGMIRTAHGLMPALAPATARLLEGFALVSREVRGELVTPTGAAILRAVRSGWAPPADGATLAATGYGAGTRELEGLANVARLTVYEQTSQPGLIREPVTRLVCEIDDQSAEQLAALEAALFAAGALDVVRVAATMKKGRLGTQIAALGHPEDTDKLALVFLRESTTLGVRVEPAERIKLEREHIRVETPWGAVSAKLGLLDGRPIKGKPEHDDCAALAREHGVPLREVMEAAQAAIYAWVRTNTNDEER